MQQLVNMEQGPGRANPVAAYRCRASASVGLTLPLILATLRPSFISFTGPEPLEAVQYSMQCDTFVSTAGSAKRQCCLRATRLIIRRAGIVATHLVTILPIHFGVQNNAAAQNARRGNVFIFKRVYLRKLI